MDGSHVIHKKNLVVSPRGVGMMLIKPSLILYITHQSLGEKVGDFF